MESGKIEAILTGELSLRHFVLLKNCISKTSFSLLFGLSGSGIPVDDKVNSKVLVIILLFFICKNLNNSLDLVCLKKNK